MPGFSVPNRYPRPSGNTEQGNSWQVSYHGSRPQPQPGSQTGNSTSNSESSTARNHEQLADGATASSARALRLLGATAEPLSAGRPPKAAVAPESPDIPATPDPSIIAVPES